MMDLIKLENIYVYHTPDKLGVYIANPENKKYYLPVKKISESIEKPELILNDNLDLEIRDGRVLLGDKIIFNISEKNLLKTISGADIQGGKFKGSFGFSYEGCCSEAELLIENTKYYKKAEDNYFRNIKLSLCKSTVRYKKGYKYEDKFATLWYLGEVNVFGMDTSFYAFSNFLPESKKSEDIWIQAEKVNVYYSNVSKYNNSPDKKSIYLFVSSKKRVEYSNQSEIIFGKDIDEIMEEIIDNYKSSNKVPCSCWSSKYYYWNFTTLIQKLFISETNFSTNNNLGDSLKDVIERNMDFCFKSFHKSIGDAYDLNYKLLSNQCLSVGPVKDRLKKNDILLDLDKISLGFCNTREININTFEELIDNFHFYSNDCAVDYDKYIDLEFSNDTDLKSILGKTYYADVIEQIKDKAVNTGGENLENFSIRNNGSIRKPHIKCSLVINLNDIANHFKVDDIRKIPEEMKNEIFLRKIYRLHLSFLV